MRMALGQFSYASGCALAILVIVAGLHNLMPVVGNPIGPALLYALVAIAAWLTGRAIRFVLLPPV
jgi:hypothetical protein